MAAPGWLTRSLADVPAGDEWLSARERSTLADLHPLRRADWRLGRWAAKAAVRAWAGERVPVEVVASAGGAPEALIAGKRGKAAISLSHRGGRALATVADPELHLGCDLELVEPRSEAFVRTWLAPAERASVSGAAGPWRPQLVNLIWSAKEAAAKARGEGLRLDPGHAVAELEWEPATDGRWRPLGVCWEREQLAVHGWWRQEPGWVFALVSGMPTAAPTPLDGAGASSAQRVS
jgi:4'-phosphopantetheinyl transferase